MALQITWKINCSYRSQIQIKWKSLKLIWNSSSSPFCISWETFLEISAVDSRPREYSICLFTDEVVEWRQTKINRAKTQVDSWPPNFFRLQTPLWVAKWGNKETCQTNLQIFHASKHTQSQHAFWLEGLRFRVEGLESSHIKIKKIEVSNSGACIQSVNLLNNFQLTRLKYVWICECNISSKNIWNI